MDIVGRLTNTTRCRPLLILVQIVVVPTAAAALMDIVVCVYWIMDNQGLFHGCLTVVSVVDEC